jgi:hypothetical protein
MGYLFVEDFKYGMDRRRPRYTGIPGSLWDGKNVHLTRGGDLERAKKFDPVYEDLEGTFGLAEINGRLYVFGSDNLAASMPTGVTYQRLQSPGSADMTRVLDVQQSDGSLYVIAEYADGNIYHFYDGTRVSDWDTLAAALASAKLTYQVLARKLASDSAVKVDPTETGVIITARNAGTAFTLTAAIANGSGTNDQTATATAVQANVPAVAGVEATADVTITGGTFSSGVNRIQQISVGPTAGTAVALLAGPVDWSGSDSATATALASAINDGTDAHGYSAAAVGSTVTITAIVDSGTTANSYSAFVTVGGDVTTSGTAGFSGGVDAVAAVAQVSSIAFGGTFEADDTITITLNGVDYLLTGLAAATGTRAHVQDGRVFSIAGPAKYYCKFNDPTDWTTATGVATDAGVIVVSTDASGAQNLVAVAPYQTYCAVFAETAVVIYQLGADPANFSRIQQLPNTGTIAGGAVLNYGSTDLFFLDATGIRSLQARDSSNTAAVGDIGTSFDPFVQSVVASASAGQLDRAVAVAEPLTGNYWLAVDDKILVLSNYPSSKVRGWTYYEPGFTPTAFARSATRVYARDADTIYVYGGLSGTVYPGAGEMVASAKLPFLSARDAAGFKHLTGFDIGCENEWNVTALVNPNDETETIALGRFPRFSYSDENVDALGEVTHFALEFECSRAGPATLSSFAVHYAGKFQA